MCVGPCTGTAHPSVLCVKIIRRKGNKQTKVLFGSAQYFSPACPGSGKHGCSSAVELCLQQALHFVIKEHLNMFGIFGFAEERIWCW